MIKEKIPFLLITIISAFILLSCSGETNIIEEISYRQPEAPPPPATPPITSLPLTTDSFSIESEINPGAIVILAGEDGVPTMTNADEVNLEAEIILTLGTTAPTQSYGITEDTNTSALTITDPSGFKLPNYYIESVDAGNPSAASPISPTITLTNKPVATTTTYTLSNNSLSIGSVSGYIQSHTGSSTLTVKKTIFPAITITIKDDESTIIQAFTTLIIRSVNEDYTIEKRISDDASGTTTQTTITTINPDGEQYECEQGDYSAITTQTALENMELTGKYCIAEDIALTRNFNPIGSEDTPFTGTLDGEGNKITGLNITATSYNVGLFAAIGSGGTVKNLTIENPTVSGEYYVGALAGQNEGSIDNVKVIDGNITASGGRLGGLVGSNEGKIEKSYASGNIEGGTDQVGGLVGTNEGKIEKSYASGNIEGAVEVGGLVGRNGAITLPPDEYTNTALERKIVDCYATGVVKGNSRVGGLVGKNGEIIYDDNSTPTFKLIGAIENSYATGVVKASGGNPFGLAGYNQRYSTVINSYFDLTTGRIGIGGTTGQTATGYSSASGTVQNNGTDITENNFATSWDFTDIWTMNPGEWPTLRP